MVTDRKLTYPASPIVFSAPRRVTCRVEYTTAGVEVFTAIVAYTIDPARRDVCLSPAGFTRRPARPPAHAGNHGRGRRCASRCGRVVGQQVARSRRRHHLGPGRRHDPRRVAAGQSPKRHGADVARSPRARRIELAHAEAQSSRSAMATAACSTPNSPAKSDLIAERRIDRDPRDKRNCSLSR